MDVAPRGNRPPRQRNGAGLADRAIPSGPTFWRARLVEPRRRQFPPTAYEGRSQDRMDSTRVVKESTGMDLHHFAARRTRSSPSAAQSMDRYARSPPAQRAQA